MIQEAQFYEKLENRQIKCHLCAHQCVVKPSKRGICGVRENRDGVFVSLVYGALIANHLDPIEKKPLFHVLPGSKSYSVATAGCNFRCDFCQNHAISQINEMNDIVRGRDTAPADIVSAALREGAESISYTYTEPTIFYEYAQDTAIIAKDKGLLNILVTNGYMNTTILEKLDGIIDAANVDLKAFQESFYRKRCGATLMPVLDSLRKMKQLGIWIEITTLIIPGQNDSPDELKQIASFILSLGRETPWHISRFYPRFKLHHLPPTSEDTLDKAYAIGRETGLKYVYIGNMSGSKGVDTHCFNCGYLLILRRGMSFVRSNLSEGKCPNCGTHLEGIF